MKDNQTIQPFAFGEALIRTVIIDALPWFVAADVCAVLELAHTGSTVARLDDDEKGVHSMHTLGGTQEMAVVNESGLYALIFKSRKAEAKRFRKWVTSEVLPTIRRTGSFSPGQIAFRSLLEDQIRLGVDPTFAARAALKLCGGHSALADKPTRPAFLSEDGIVELLQEGIEYDVERILSILPLDHPILRRFATIMGRRSAIGSAMEKAWSAGFIERIRGRKKTYKLLPKVVDFPAAGN